MKKVAENFVIFGEADGLTVSQMQTCLNAGGDYAALMSDNHKGYSQPIGGVIAYTDSISISGIGFDQHCGCMAIRTDLSFSDITEGVDKIVDEISARISFGMGRVNSTPIDHPLFEEDIWKVEPFKDWKKMAREQLGTVGSGNHFTDLFVDEQLTIWVGVHFGSRGLGHKTATYFLKQAGGRDGMDVPPCLVKADSELGQFFLSALDLTSQYAYAGREYVCRYIVEHILGGNIMEEVHNHHNAVWLESHFGQDFWVVRKGATPAFPGQKGFVGGSMGDNSVILEGIDSELSKFALYSTVHGAGRVMSRTQAKGKFVRDEATGKKIRTQGLVRHDEMMKWLKDKGVTLRGGDLDEAPQAYRRLPDVLEAHAGTIKILHNLRPIGVVMAGKNVKDLYKD
jgi:tRNA-splicing ligase RtcB